MQKSTTRWHTVSKLSFIHFSKPANAPLWGFYLDTKKHKGLIYLALMDSEKWAKTAHVKSYIVDFSPKRKEYFFSKYPVAPCGTPW